MRPPTDEEIRRALCCGMRCRRGPNSGQCHAWDFQGEAARIRALLDWTAPPSPTTAHCEPKQEQEIER